MYNMSSLESQHLSEFVKKITDKSKTWWTNRHFGFFKKDMA